MKQLLISVLSAIITIALIAATVFGFMWYAERQYMKDMQSTAPVHAPCKTAPAGLAIERHNFVPDVDQVAIFGVAHNSSNLEWRDAVISATIGKPGSQINECETRLIGPIPAGAKRPFLIQCSKTEITQESAVIEYQVKISEACEAAG
ncbi:hypothetical protein [Thermomonas carbonis]|uniref:Uncharacterized protein n=2 Tax=Thermomonas carbonis TaxID=1463158 RepID=A0A7G9SNL4_9GAMM|nr:hypothetical protein [Thermomonas carbonis]QNN69439.1 hypothetical protein H9L16_12240 [Thermomonas carbonis]